MDRAWPASPGEAMHTSTYLGHPVGCVMALAQIAEIERLKLPEAAAEKGAYFMKLLRKLRVPATLRAEVRGRGLMVGLELSHTDGSPAGALVIDLVKRALAHGLMLLPEAEAGNVIGFTPPLTITRAQLRHTVQVIQTLLNEPTN
jgi:4-aminobutyrate aminotransferase-like enzyme